MRRERKILFLVTAFLPHYPYSYIEDIRQEIALAILEHPDWDDFKVANAVRRKFYADYIAPKRLFVVTSAVAERPTPTEREADAYDILLAEILAYYETHTASETIAHFGLPDTQEVRKLLSACRPKPHRKSGKRHGKYKKVFVGGKTAKELIKEGLPRPAAYRAVKRGYYYKFQQ